MDSQDPQLKRKRTFRQDASRKQPKRDDAPSGAFSGFGAKMMAKMGWSAGQGLGKEAQGINAPIQVKLRPTKGGVGAISEKTDAQKQHERRVAEQNGEKYEESSEEERKQRRKKKTVSGTHTPSTARPKPQKTIFDLEAAGMQVPQALQSIVDATTGQSTSTSALSLRGTGVPFQTSLASRVQREVAAFGDAVEAVQNDAQNIEYEMERLNAEMENLNMRLFELGDIRARVDALRNQTDVSAVCDSLSDLQATYPSRNFQLEAVAALHPHFTRLIASWSPSSDPLQDLAASLEGVQSIVNPSNHRPSSNEVGRYNPRTLGNEPTNRRSTTLYQSMMLSWWAQFHTAMVNDLEVDGGSASAFIHAIEVWKPVLPAFIVQRVTTEIKRKVTAVLQQWNPRKAIKHKSSSPLPQWIFQWLPYDSDILSEVTPKLRILFSIWPVHRGVMSGIHLWKKAFPTEIDQILVKQLLPRLASHLRDDFEMNPAEQDLEPITAVTNWSGVLSARVIAELLHAEFFTSKFLPTLLDWLKYEGRVLTEIGEWMSWWKSVFPEEINDIQIIHRDWEEAYNLVNTALDLEGQDLENLALPHVETPRTPTPETSQFSKSVNTEPPRSVRKEIEETTFKDIVETWCAEENLLLIPLRKADETTGFPLFRITASATGKGGVVAYFKGDVLWAQNKKDKSLWEPVGLEEGLVLRAEGK